MQRLRQYNSVKRNEGYMLDHGEPGAIRAVLNILFGTIGILLVKLYHYTLYPLHSKGVGDRRQGKYARLLEEFPASLICPECGHILKIK